MSLLPRGAAGRSESAEAAVLQAAADATAAGLQQLTNGLCRSGVSEDELKG